MRQRRAVSGAFFVVLAAAVWLAWSAAQPLPRTGDVPYVPTRLPVVDRMLQLAGVTDEDLLYDLGSGDGRIVVRAAELYGARAVGYELDSSLVAESRRAAAALGVGAQVRFIERDLFDADLRPATVVTLYLLPTVNLELRPKLIAELAPGTPVVSQTFDMAEWLPDARDTVEGLDPPADLYRWTVPAAFGGIWSTATDGGGSMTLKLRQSFQQVEGTLTTAAGSVPVTGTIDGRAIGVESVRPLSGATVGVVLSGELHGDEWRGEVVAGMRAGPFTAGRSASRIAGTWRIESAAGRDESPTIIRIERSPGGWAAFHGDGDRRPINDFYVWGAAVYWVVDGGAGESTRSIYSGLVEGDNMSGTRLDGTRLTPWTARRGR